MFLAHQDFFYDIKKQNPWLLINGDEGKLNDVKNALRSAGYTGLWHGLCKYPGSNGRQYQWYIRVQKESGAFPSLNEMIVFFRAYNERTPVSGQTGEQQEQIKQLRDEIAFLTDRLEESQSLHTEQSQQYQDTQAQLEASKLLLQQIEAEREEIERQLFIKQRDEQERRKQHESDQEIFNLASQETVDLQNRLAQIEAEREILSERLREVETERDDLQRVLSSNNNQSQNTFKKDLRDILQGLLCVEFMKGSMEVLLSLENYASVMDALREICTTGATHPRTKSAPAWSEAYFLTGRDSRGRIFYTQTLDHGRKLVSIYYKHSDKDEQKHLEELNRHCKR